MKPTINKNKPPGKKCKINTKPNKNVKTLIEIKKGQILGAGINQLCR
jgi:hypothetical protein